MLENKAITQTKNWIKNVVIDCNFCPFAAKAVMQKTIHYNVQQHITQTESIEVLKAEIDFLNTNAEIETSFIIFETDFLDFTDYLSLVKKAETWLTQNKYDGVYQIASFHPNYCFADAEENDPANFTNRSIYPMLHLIKEDSITKALQHFKNSENIPLNNIEFARKKGLDYMQLLRLACV